MTEAGPGRRRMTVIGDGQMGLVMAEALACGAHEVRLWGPFPEHVAQLARTRLSDRLPGYRLGESIEVCAEILQVILARTAGCGVPLGVSVESVSGFREEIDGAVRRTTVPASARKC